MPRNICRTNYRRRLITQPRTVAVRPASAPRPSSWLPTLASSLLTFLASDNAAAVAKIIWATFSGSC
jgi:hypothetical protein